MYTVQKPSEVSSESDSDMSDKEFYSCLQEKNSTFLSADESPDQNTNVSRTQALHFLNSKKKDLCMLDDYPIVKQAFLKHNTYQSIPSSVPWNPWKDFSVEQFRF